MFHRPLPAGPSPAPTKPIGPDPLPAGLDPRTAEIVRLAQRKLPTVSVSEALLLCQFEWPDDEAYSCWLHTAEPAEVARMIVSAVRKAHGGSHSGRGHRPVPRAG